MALPALGPRRLALAATCAVVLAGAGTFLAVRAQGEAATARTAAQVRQAAAPVIGALPAPLKAAPGKVGAIAEHVGPAGLRRIRSTIAAHAPSKAIEQASRAVAGGGPTAKDGRPRPRAGGARPGTWVRRPFGRGVIIKRR